MKSLIKDLIIPFLAEADIPEVEKTVGVFGGGFQPPTKGHFEVVKRALEMHPGLSQFIIFVGTGGGRSDITQEQSVAIWNIYKQYLPSKVSIVPSSNPISSVYSYAKDNPTTQVKWFLGSREGNIKDFDEFEKRTKSVLGKTNLEPINIITTGGVSGTAARAVLDDKEKFFTYLPNIEEEDKEQIYSILKPNQVNEIVPEPEINSIDKYADDVLDPLNLKISHHFVDRVNDKRNNPPIETDELYDFFDKLSDEKDELEDMLDNKGEIVATDSDTDINIPLAKDNRKPNTVVAKTIMRKKNFATSNPKLVFEDFFKPIQNQDLNMKISSEPTRVEYYKDHIKNVVPSDFKVEKQKDKIIVSNIVKKGLEHDPEFKKLLVSLTMHMMDHINIEPLPDIIFIEDDKQNASDMLGKTAYYNHENSSITLYTCNRHPKDILRSYAHEMIHHMQNLEGRIKNIHGQNINEDEYLKELEEEAYRLGNGLLFRGWENNLKND